MRQVFSSSFSLSSLKLYTQPAPRQVPFDAHSISGLVQKICYGSLPTARAPKEMFSDVKMSKRCQTLLKLLKQVNIMDVFAILQYFFGSFEQIQGIWVRQGRFYDDEKKGIVKMGE